MLVYQRVISTLHVMVSQAQGCSGFVQKTYRQRRRRFSGPQTVAELQTVAKISDSNGEIFAKTQTQHQLALRIVKRSKLLQEFHHEKTTLVYRERQASPLKTRTDDHQHLWGGAMLISAMDQVIAGRWTHQIRFFPSSVSLWVSAQIKVGCGCRVQFPVRFWWGFWVVPGGSGCGMGFRGYRFFFGWKLTGFWCWGYDLDLFTYVKYIKVP